MEAGRELDALIAKKVFGVTEFHTSAFAFNKNAPSGFWRYYVDCPPFSTNITAAWEVLETLPRTLWPEVGRMDDGRWYCEIVSRGDAPAEVSPGPIAREIADTAPLAICRATLLAVEVV